MPERARCVSESRIGPVGARGMWLTDDSFRIEMKFIGTPHTKHYDLTFLQVGLQVVAMDRAGGGSGVVFGFKAG